jgi:hypothetical protein
MRLHPRHSGLASEHFTLRRLQLKQPRRDLLKPLPGTGFLRLDADGECFSAPEAVLSSVPGVVVLLSTEREGCLRGMKMDDKLSSDIGGSLDFAMESGVGIEGQVGC